MDSHALTVLGFDKIVAMLVERTSFEPGAERAAQVSPLVDARSIERLAESTSEMRALMDAGERIPVAGARDVRRALETASREGSALSSQDLVAVARTLATVRGVRTFLSKRRERCPLLWDLSGELATHEEVEEAIAGAIDDSSYEVLDRASRQLSKIRRTMESTRARLNDRLQEIIRKEQARGTIQEPVISMRQGRFVVPVKTGEKGRFKGIVHDQSSSGATYFIEPLATVDLNNDLATLSAEERQEIDRILRGLTSAVREVREDLARSLRILSELDYLHAASLLSRDLGCTRPRLTTQRIVRLRKARHPILLELVGRDASRVVPLDLDLGEKAATLVISGPNTGGKTVALKTVGLLVAMAQSGLHVPAEDGTELGVFSNVFADIGDEQSIEQSLSTFSSHMGVIIRILTTADEASLVLLDELGAGTDPDEGASIAVAVLEELTERSVLTIATTHHGSVKNFVHDRDGMVNGSMTFDPDTLEPTFRFVASIPGSSHALAIAETLGLSERLVERARDLRSKDAAKVDGLLIELSERDRALKAALDDTERERQRAARFAREYEERLADVRAERKGIKERALLEARETIDQAKSLVESVVKELKATEAARETIRAAREKLRERRAGLQREIEEERPAPPETHRAVPEELSPGMKVWVASLRKSGKLLDVPDDRGRVRVRMKRATVEIDSGDLREIDETHDVSERPERGVSFDVPDEMPAAVEVDLRGMTTDDIEGVIERHLSRAVVQGLTTVRIIHGKGTGALRSRTHEVLGRMPGVRRFRIGRYGEGDIGVTIVELE